MKKFLFYVLILSVLVLAACGETEDNSSEEEGVATGESTNEMSELEEENEELRRQLEEQDDEDGDSEATGEAESNGDPSEPSDDSESTEADDDQDDNTEGNRSDLVFDINSSEVQAYINKEDNYDDEGNFIQDVISIGMSQNEIEELYGEYDYTITSPTDVGVVYENLIILYDSYAPYGDGTDGSDSSIDPDKNRVEMILYFADLSVEELSNALGTPDDQLTNLVGLQNYIYNGDSSNDEWESVVFTTDETPNGLRVGTLRGRDPVENPDEADQSTVNEDDFKLYEGAISEYLHRLASYYNYDNYDDIFYYLEEGSAAYNKVTANKNSGYFADHVTHDVALLDVEALDNQTIKLNVNRVYEHENSEGKQIANVDYFMDPDTLELLDYQENTNENYTN